MRERGNWTRMLRRAGAAYAAIIVSIVGIKIPQEDVTAAKKPTERSRAVASPHGGVTEEGASENVVPLDSDRY